MKTIIAALQKSEEKERHVGIKNELRRVMAKAQKVETEQPGTTFMFNGWTMEQLSDKIAKGDTRLRDRFIQYIKLLEDTASKYFVKTLSTAIPTPLQEMEQMADLKDKGGNP